MYHFLALCILACVPTCIKGAPADPTDTPPVTLLTIDNVIVVEINDPSVSEDFILKITHFYESTCNDTPWPTYFTLDQGYVNGNYSDMIKDLQNAESVGKKAEWYTHLLDVSSQLVYDSGEIFGILKITQDDGSPPDIPGGVGPYNPRYEPELRKILINYTAKQDADSTSNIPTSTPASDDAGSDEQPANSDPGPHPWENEVPLKAFNIRTAGGVSDDNRSFYAKGIDFAYAQVTDAKGAGPKHDYFVALAFLSGLIGSYIKTYVTKKALDLTLSETIALWSAVQLGRSVLKAAEDSSTQKRRGTPTTYGEVRAGLASLTTVEKPHNSQPGQVDVPRGQMKKKEFDDFVAQKPDCAVAGVGGGDTSLNS